MVELFDHVAVHLDVVPLGLDVSDLLLVELEVALQLGCGHGFPLVVGLLLLLGFFGHAIL